LVSNEDTMEILEEEYEKEYCSAYIMETAFL